MICGQDAGCVIGDAPLSRARVALVIAAVVLVIAAVTFLLQ